MIHSRPFKKGIVKLKLKYCQFYQQQANIAIFLNYDDVMDVMKNKKVTYCVDFVTVHHCTKFRSHICNIGDFTEGTLCAPPRYYKDPKSPVLIGLRRLTRKPKVRTAEVRLPRWKVWSLSVTQARIDQSHVNSGRRGRLMVKHPWPLLEISPSDSRRLATLNMITYLTFLPFWPRKEMTQ